MRLIIFQRNLRCKSYKNRESCDSFDVNNYGNQIRRGSHTKLEVFTAFFKKFVSDFVPDVSYSLCLRHTV